MADEKKESGGRQASEAKTSKADAHAKELAGVATPEQNKKLEHTESGVTSRDDLLDQGVPMLQGDPAEAQGPEDAFGVGSKRGDYAARTHTENVSHESVPIEGGGEPILDGDGNLVDFSPVSKLEPQGPRVEDIGEVAGEKGGVTTA